MRVERKERCTDADGRLSIQLDDDLPSRVCDIEFDINGYFATLGATPFYPRINIVVRLSHSISRYEIIVLITPSSYCVIREPE